jgi:predicted nucleic acid-binding protein
MLATVRAACTIVPLSEETQDVGLQITEKFRLSLYDAMIVAAALLAECKTLLSEDLKHGRTVEGKLQVRNPFR